VRLVLLGDPVAHSLSPAIHRAALSATGIAGTYEARAVDASGLGGAIAEMRYGALQGGNVTMPHKQLAFAECDLVSDDALRTGAVNTLVAEAGSVRGHNTDVFGVRYAWAHRSLPDGPVLVLGAGGAAAAALVALDGRELFVSARHPGAASSLIERTRATAASVPWGTGIPGVLVNATPIGMHGEELPSSLIDSATGLLEMPYASGTTPAEARAVSAGLPVSSGVDMLLGQAMASFTLWTGRDAPEDAMREAIEGARRSQEAD
jgi:shikimate dehydrogenase